MSPSERSPSSSSTATRSEAVSSQSTTARPRPVVGASTVSVGPTSSVSRISPYFLRMPSMNSAHGCTESRSLSSGDACSASRR